MVRTQIYITDKERASLQNIAKQTGSSQSELIRQAIDGFLNQFTQPDRKELLQQAKGIWEHRKDLPDFRAIRNEFDRFEDAPADKK